MSNTSEIIETFFASYATRVNNALAERPLVDTKGVMDSFAEYFVGANPDGVSGGKNGVRFRLTIPGGFAFYRKIGIKSMTIKSVTTTPLDDMHHAANVQWEAHYLKEGNTAEPIEFTNIYLLQIQKDEPRIFAFITGDETRALKEHGLI